MKIVRGRVAVTVAVIIIVDHVYRSSHTTSPIHRSMGDMCRFLNSFILIVSFKRHQIEAQSPMRSLTHSLAAN